VARARRAYYARKRKPLKVQVPGPERVIPRDGVIEHIVLIPRFWITAPIHINALIARLTGRERSDHPAKEPTDGITNVTPLGKR
jgi:hypothetical protein